MRTRCPDCSTVFRVTPEQLRLKGGKVRCGHCQGVFNAFDHLVESPVPPPESESKEPFPPLAPLVPRPLPSRAPTTGQESPGDGSASAAAPAPSQPAPSDPAPPIAQESPDEPGSDSDTASANDRPPSAPPAVPAASSVPPPDPLVKTPPLSPGDAEEPRHSTPGDIALSPEADPAESVEDSTRAAREAGLVAARDLTDTPAYNRWAAGTLAAPEGGFFDTPASSRQPFIIAALLLLIVLLGQLAYHWRGPITLRHPETQEIYRSLGIAVPLPRHADLVAIEASDLQTARGLLLLQATLHNRATYAQDWPALELTLTDTHDTVISRRVMLPADYLPPTADAAQFPARSELALRLWFDGKELGAAGYRLYIFYP